MKINDILMKPDIITRIFEFYCFKKYLSSVLYMANILSIMYPDILGIGFLKK